MVDNTEKNNRNIVVDKVRRMLEKILFDEQFNFNDKEEYFETLKYKNSELADRIIEKILISSK